MKRILVSLMIVCFLAGIFQNLYASSDKIKITLVTRRLSYLKVNTAIHFLKPYLSSKGDIIAVRERNTLIIQDIPEVMDKLLAIIDSIDVKPVDLQFTIDLILGSRVLDSKGDKDTKKETHKELKDDPLIKELQELLKYNSFRNMGATIVKVQDNSESSHWLGKYLQLRMAPQITKEGSILVEVVLYLYRGTNKEGKELKRLLFETSLTLKNKERTVIGVSKLNGDKEALILLVTGTIIK